MEFAMATGIMDQTSVTIDIGMETRPCSDQISIRRARSKFFAKISSLSCNPVASALLNGNMNVSD